MFTWFSKKKAFFHLSDIRIEEWKQFSNPEIIKPCDLWNHLLVIVNG